MRPQNLRERRDVAHAVEEGLPLQVARRHQHPADDAATEWTKRFSKADTADIEILEQRAKVS